MREYYIHFETSDTGQPNHFELLRIDEDGSASLISTKVDISSNREYNTVDRDELWSILLNINKDDVVYTFNGEWLTSLLHSIYPNISEVLHRGAVISLMHVMSYIDKRERFDLKNICLRLDIDLTLPKTLRFYLINNYIKQKMTH